MIENILTTGFRLSHMCLTIKCATSAAGLDAQANLRLSSVPTSRAYNITARLAGRLFTRGRESGKFSKFQLFLRPGREFHKPLVKESTYTRNSQRVQNQNQECFISFLNLMSLFLKFHSKTNINIPNQRTH